MFLGGYLFVFGFYLVVFYGVFYIILLLGLELMLLGVFVSLCTSFLVMSMGKGLFSFLVVMVCMGGFSVSLLVAVSRVSGRGLWVLKYMY